MDVKMGSSPHIHVTTLPILANDRCFFTRQNNFQMNWSVGSQKAFEELKSGDCSCNTKYFKYFELEYCKANRKKVGMGCTSLPACLSLQIYCSPSSKGKNLVYFTFLAQAFYLLSHLCLSQQISPCSFPKVKIAHELQTLLRKHGADVNISEVIHPLPKHTRGWGSRAVAVKSSEVNKQKQHKVSVFYQVLWHRDR